MYGLETNMATDIDFVNYLRDHIRHPDLISVKKMFGEYAMYYDTKVVALICDNQLFIKPTDAGRHYIGNELIEAAPYSGAKNYFLIDDRLEDSEWLSKLIKVTADALPLPKK